MFDLDYARAQFPTLATPWALMDNAGGSAPVRQVVERIREHLLVRPVQLGASYSLSLEAQASVDAGRAAAAKLVGADPDEVVLGASTTALLATLARALRPQWAEGDEVIVTDLDHEANIGPWRRLAESGIVVKEWPFDVESGRLRLEELEPLLGPRTRLVAFTHCANVIGDLHDAATFCRRIREAGALSCVDGVAFAPHRRVDVRELGCDVYALSFYKVYGPHIAALFGRREVLLGARGQSHHFVGEEQVPQKLEPGGVCYELAAGLPGVVEYLEGLDARHREDGAAGTLEGAFERIAAYEMDLAAPLLGFLEEHPRVRLFGGARADAETRVPTVAFAVDGLDASVLPEQLERRQLAVRYGHFYAPRAIERLGLAERGGIVRVSLVHYNAHGEVLRLIDALDELL